MGHVAAFLDAMLTQLNCALHELDDNAEEMDEAILDNFIETLDLGNVKKVVFTALSEQDYEVALVFCGGRWAYARASCGFAYNRDVIPDMPESVFSGTAEQTVWYAHEWCDLARYIPDWDAVQWDFLHNLQDIEFCYENSTRVFRFCYQEDVSDGDFMRDVGRIVDQNTTFGSLFGRTSVPFELKIRSKDFCVYVTAGGLDEMLFDCHTANISRCARYIVMYM